MFSFFLHPVSLVEILVANVVSRKTISLEITSIYFYHYLTIYHSFQIARRHPVADHCASLQDDDLNPIRWFMIPSEAQDLLLGHSRNVKQEVPFSPTAYKGSRPAPDQQGKVLKKVMSTPDTTDHLFR